MSHEKRVYTSELIAAQWQVVKASEQAGFQALPRRWVVERTFAWLGQYRRLSKDYERCAKSSGGFVCIASIHTMLRRITAAA